MKNVLVFTSTFPRFTAGDATPPFVYELSRRLVRDDQNIIVLTPRVPGTRRYEERDGLKIYRYPYSFSEKLEKLCDGAILPNIKANKWLYLQVPFFLLSGILNLAKIIKQEKIDTIHAHWIIPQGFLAVLYKKIYGKNIKVLCTTHGGDIFGLRGRIGTCIKKFTLQNIDVLTVVSHAIKSECLKLGIPEKKIHVIPMGVDALLFNKNKEDPSIKKQYNIQGKLLLFVGRLAEKKGVQYLIDALPGILAEYPDAKLMIIGHGPLESELKKQVKNLEIESNVIFVGGIPNGELPKYYATADIFIGPSIETKSGDSEGFGLVFVEAILSGCITLGSNLHGITDIIQDGKTGFLVAQKESASITEVLQRVMGPIVFDREHAEKITREKSDWNHIGQKYFTLLSETVGD